MRLQTIVSREVAADRGRRGHRRRRCRPARRRTSSRTRRIIKLNVRTFDEGVRKRVLAAIERIVNAEAAASGAPRPPEITPLDRYPLNVNDQEASERVADAFRAAFLRRARAANRAGSGERGLRLVRRRVACPVGVLVRRRHRSRRLREGQGGGPAQRAFRPTTARASRRSSIRPWRTGVETMVVAARAWLAAA